jgi:hypothetical protein
MKNLTNAQVAEIVESNKKFDYIPESYDSLYRVYFAPKYSLVNMLVKKAFKGFLRDHDLFLTLPHDIFARCLEQDILTKFDPDKGNFGGLLFMVVRTIAENFRRHRKIDPMGKNLSGSLEAVDEDADFTPGVYDIDAMCKPTPDCVRQLISQQGVDNLFTFAQQAHDRGKTKRDRSLLPLLKLLYIQEENETIYEALDVTDTTVVNWKSYLRNSVQF